VEAWEKDVWALLRHMPRSKECGNVFSYRTHTLGNLFGPFPFTSLENFVNKTFILL